MLVPAVLGLAACGIDAVGSRVIDGDASVDASTNVDDAAVDGSIADAGETDASSDAGTKSDADASVVACPDASTTFTGGTLTIPKAAQAVTLDGDLGEWSCARFFSYDAGTAAVVDAVVNGANVYSFAVAWDSAYLYVAARVKDATMPRGDNTGSQIYKNDAIEVFFGNDSPYTSTFSSRDHQYVVDWANRAYEYQPTGGNVPPAGFVSAAKSSATGFDVELRVPASQLGVGSFSASMTLGFAFAIDECNGANQHGWALWHRPTGISCSTGCCQIWCDARYFGGLVLKD
jgi:hypothetical protein